MRVRSYDDLRRLTAYLQTIADWKDGFERRARQAQQRLEAGALIAEEQDQLLKEGMALLELMQRVTGNERRAA